MRKLFPTFAAAIDLCWDLLATFCIWITGTKQEIRPEQYATTQVLNADPLIDREVLVIDRFHAYHGEVGTIEHRISDSNQPTYMVSFLQIPGNPVAILGPMQFMDNALAQRAGLIVEGA